MRVINYLTRHPSGFNTNTQMLMEDFQGQNLEKYLLAVKNDMKCRKVTEENTRIESTFEEQTFTDYSLRNIEAFQSEQDEILKGHGKAASKFIVMSTVKVAQELRLTKERDMSECDSSNKDG